MRADVLEGLKGEFLRLSSGKLSGQQRSTTTSEWGIDAGASVSTSSRFSTAVRHRSLGNEFLGDGGLMSMTLAYAIALADARSCLAALADATTDFDESSHFEHLLLDLDGLHPIGPGLSPIVGTRAERLARLEDAVTAMIALGGDGLRLELLLVSATSVGTCKCRSRERPFRTFPKRRSPPTNYGCLPRRLRRAFATSWTPSTT
jgi:hypothetical protein